MSTILLLLDAFRHDYLSKSTTPFLWQCAQDGEYYSNVTQSMGFCERSEILTGLTGEESGFFTAIGYDPKRSPFVNVSGLRFLNLVEKSLFYFSSLFSKNCGIQVEKVFRYFISMQFRKMGIVMSSYFIPYSWLRYFALTEDQIDHRDPVAFPISSILTLLDKAGRTYFYDAFTALNFLSPYQSDKDRLNAVIDDIKESPKDLYLVYISAPDVYGHLYGPESSEFHEVLKGMDKDVAYFVRMLEQKAPGNQYLFLGDHGMVTVTKRIDAEKEILHLLRALNLRKERDVIYFLDSTMARFWLLSKKAYQTLPNVLKMSELFNINGTWMNKEMASRCHVPWPDRRYGDYLWVANPGILIFPDFFHRVKPCVGMHGYDPNLPESQGMCILWGKDIPPREHSVIPLRKVFNLLRRNLNL